MTKVPLGGYNIDEEQRGSSKREDDAMSISTTTFRIAQRTLSGPEAFEQILLALREVLPYCLIDCVQLNRHKFPINANRYPRAIWHELLSKREWHPKLVYHLVNSLAETDHVRRMSEQAEFARLINDPNTHVMLHGTVLYESEGTPDMLQARGIPVAQSHGCDLQVDAYTEFVKKAHRDKEFEESHAVQREQYGRLSFLEEEQVEQPTQSAVL